jgi:hypothetical protein
VKSKLKGPTTLANAVRNPHNIAYNNANFQSLGINKSMATAKSKMPAINKNRIAVVSEIGKILRHIVTKFPGRG